MSGCRVARPQRQTSRFCAARLRVAESAQATHSGGNALPEGPAVISCRRWLCCLRGGLALSSLRALTSGRAVRPLGIWLVGFGTVGRWLAGALDAQAGQLASRYGC